MDEYYYQRLLNDPKTFVATESVRKLEVWTFAVLPLSLLKRKLRATSNKYRVDLAKLYLEKMKSPGGSWKDGGCRMYVYVPRTILGLIAKIGTRIYVSQKASGTHYPQSFVSHKLVIFVL